MHLLRRLKKAWAAACSKREFSGKEVYRQRANTVERQDRWRQGAILLPPIFLWRVSLVEVGTPESLNRVSAPTGCSESSPLGELQWDSG